VTCPVRKMSSLRVFQSASWHIHELWVGLKSDGTCDRTLSAARGYATSYMQSYGIDNGSGTNEGDVAFRDVKIEFFG